MLTADSCIKFYQWRSIVSLTRITTIPNIDVNALQRIILSGPSQLRLVQHIFHTVDVIRFFLADKRTE